ncbi:TPM domain-containing protein [Paludisphaera mucosa]|uniref:TPM domain-containing protein n=1 Tax=Paludisphaera mucosa TaxID=3030827 RepID=A0ABT6FIG2_9BACT|nr:TPM domain-containing protein [Paludisphaera mucosa]MDG3007324.1 TPM domain-containing protein [Paludisphaera mucosa]
MFRSLRWTALPLVAAALAWAPARAAEVRDQAGMFSPQAVKKAQVELTRVEKQTGVPIIIETIESIPGLAADASIEAKKRAIDSLAEKRDAELHDEGIYILLSKKDKVLSHVLVRQRLAGVLPESTRRTIREAFVAPFKDGDYDGGLAAAATAIDAALPDEPVAAARAAGPRRLVPAAPAPGGGVVVERRAQQGAQFGFGTLLMIALGILGVLFVVRLLSGAFGGGQAGYPQGMPRPGPGMGGPGYGPGMGGPGYGGGYGGRGGGFFSSMLGGIGGAMAGNWIYDQFSGRNSGHHSDASSYTPMTGQDDFGPTSPDGGDAIIGGSDDSQGGSWGDSGGGDWGGGSGGGDWGGGGGDDGGSW